MISVESQGDFSNTESWLKRMTTGEIFNTLDRWGEVGRQALIAATPKDSGVTASSWNYEIKRDSKSYSIIWGNTKVVDGTPVVILLQYGHGTGTGGYVQGRDFINPALKPIFEKIANEVWKAVTS